MAEQKPERPKTRKRLGRWFWVLITVVGLIILITVLTPVILSSKEFTRWVQARISRSTGGEATIGDLSVGWLKGVRIADFRYRGPQGWTEVDVGQIIATPSLGSLLGGTLALDRAVVNRPRIAVDLRERPPSEAASVDMNDLRRLHELVVRDGSIQLTNTAGRTVQITDLNSDLTVRPPGRTSSLDANFAVPSGQQPGRVTLAGQATPAAKTGWSLRGTTGNVTVEVNDLNLGSITPFLELAGVPVQAEGRVSGNIAGALQNGQIENLHATLVGQNVDVTGEALQGDRVQTSRLNVTANLAQADDAINVSQLNVQTDWARVEATGTLPKTPASLNKLLESGEAYDVKGRFDINLAAVLSQMPNTFAVQRATQITGGRATGDIDSTTEGGRAVLIAKAEITGLASVTGNQQVRLSGPVQTTLRLSTGGQGAQLDNLSVTAPFAKLTASGSLKLINYQGQADLAALQSNLGPFINLGRYNLAGQTASQGQISLGDKVTGVSGSLSAQQLVVTSADGNSVTEPQANVDFQVALNQQEQVLAVKALTAKASFGTISIQDATVPLGQKSQSPLRLALQARDVNLNRVEPYAAFLGSPLPVTLQGIAQSQVTITGQAGTYHIISDGTRIQDFRMISPEKELFAQPQVTALFDIFVDLDQKMINRASWQVNSPQITTKGQLTQTSQDSTIKAQGALDGQLDWAAVAPLASGFVPGQLSITGQKPIAINFTSTYRANEPRGLLAHLTGQASLGFDRADYQGLSFGSTEVNLRAENGLMRVGPLATTVNNGRFNYTGEANLAQSPIILRTTTPLHLAQGVQINVETTRQFLKYANPIFAEVATVDGIANLDVQSMVIPLASNAANRAQLTGTIGINRLTLGASSILNQILAIAGQTVRGQVMTILPTNLTLQNGVVRYDNMQINVGDNPVNFGGAIGLNGILDMTVVLPYTIEGRTVRVGQPETGQRLAVPLTGTLDKPELNLEKLLQLQLQQGLEQLFKRLR
jgi:hypothetical protein